MPQDTRLKVQILITDDEPDFIEFVAWQLEKRGYQIITALSGQDALNIIAEKKIHLLLADIRMPGIDGIELVQHAIRINPDIQCIMITGHGQMETAIAAMKAGAINYLRKPIGIEELDIAIQKGIEKISLIQKARQSQERLEKANTELRQLKDRLKQALKNETLKRKEAQSELDKIRIKESIIDVMNLSLRLYKQSTQKSKIDLALDSKIWTVNIDSGGTYRTRTLDRYLKLQGLPPNPRYNDVIDTAYFVLSTCPITDQMKYDLKRKVETLEELISKSA